MPLIVWQDDYRVHIPEIDEQHQEMIANLNRLADAVENRAQLCALFSQFVDHVLMHCETEENYLSRFDYLEAESHKRLHRAFIQKVSKLDVELMEQRVQLSDEVMRFLGEWTREHLQVDQRWASLAKE